MRYTFESDGLESLTRKMAEAVEKAAYETAVQAAKDTEPYVPMLTGSLKNRTQVKGNTIIYPGPYARYLYYGKVMVDSKTGKGPMHFTDKKGNEVIRFHKGAKLRPTNKDLQFNTASHKNAQAHWFEASKAQNKDKWLGVMAKAINKNLK